MKGEGKVSSLLGGLNADSTVDSLLFSGLSLFQSCLQGCGGNLVISWTLFPKQMRFLLFFQMNMRIPVKGNVCNSYQVRLFSKAKSAHITYLSTT